ncbi:MAG: hypothetical protein ACKO96_11385, partial [Flammeovirgaceae bacterium]
ESSDNDKIELFFEEETNDNKSHWTNGKDIKSSGKNNCLYDAIAQRSSLCISGQDLRLKVAGHIKNNSYFYLKMQQAVDYIRKTCYGNTIKCKNLLMIGGDQDQVYEMCKKTINVTRNALPNGCANQEEYETRNQEKMSEEDINRKLQCLAGFLVCR